MSRFTLPFFTVMQSAAAVQLKDKKFPKWSLIWITGQYFRRLTTTTNSFHHIWGKEDIKSIQMNKSNYRKEEKSVFMGELSLWQSVI